MTNPLPAEDAIKSMCPELVANVVMVGDHLPRPLLYVELADDADAAAAGARLCAAVDAANLGLPEYSSLSLED
eukprot:3120995-Prymnesium_polylepis.1